MDSMLSKKNRGLGIVEIIIGVAIITIGLIAVSTAYTTYVQYALANEKNVEASYLLEEGMEGLTFLCDKSWSTNIFPLSTTTTYYLTWTGTYWNATTTAQYVDGQFLRSFTLTDVLRNGSDAIASSGTFDPNTKKVSVSVAYFQGHATTTQTLQGYVANLYKN